MSAYRNQTGGSVIKDEVATKSASGLVFTSRDPWRPAAVSGRDLRDAIIVTLRLIDRLDPMYDSFSDVERKAVEALQASVRGRVPGSEVYAE